ncbi:MAG: hypothetical protein ABIJ86_17540 [Spirochaetota bacterium]
MRQGTSVFAGSGPGEPDKDHRRRSALPFPSHPAFSEGPACLEILRREVGGKNPICAYITATKTLPALHCELDKLALVSRMALAERSGRNIIVVYGDRKSMEKVEDVDDRLIGILKTEGMLIATTEVRKILQPFFNFAALFLKNEMESHIKLTKVANLAAKLDQLVKEQTAELESKNDELERMNKLSVGRELWMIELKDKITELENHERS